jgi:hypothetical protein
MCWNKNVEIEGDPAGWTSACCHAFVVLIRLVSGKLEVGVGRGRRTGIPPTANMRLTPYSPIGFLVLASWTWCLHQTVPREAHGHLITIISCVDELITSNRNAPQTW